MPTLVGRGLSKSGCEASALSACCAFGGGFRTGKSILMEDQSPIRCRASNSSSNVIVCECSDETQRYDIETSSCISSCTPGERWESVISDLYDSINSDVGRCVPCLAGTVSVPSMDGWKHVRTAAESTWHKWFFHMSFERVVLTNTSFVENLNLTCVPPGTASSRKVVQCVRIVLKEPMLIRTEHRHVPSAIRESTPLKRVNLNVTSVPREPTVSSRKVVRCV